MSDRIFIQSNQPFRAAVGDQWQNNSNPEDNEFHICISGGRSAQWQQVFGGTDGLGKVNFSAGTSSRNLSKVVFSNANGISFGLSNSTITASVSSAAGATLSYWANMDKLDAANASTMAAVGVSTLSVVPFVLQQPASIGFMRAFMSISAVSTTQTVIGSTGYTVSGTRFNTMGSVFMTQGTGASSMSLQSYASTSAGLTAVTAVGVSDQSTQYTVSLFLTAPFSNGTTTGSWSYASSSNRYVITLSQLSDVTGFRVMDVPFASLLSQGNYWVVLGHSTAYSSATAGGVDPPGLASNVMTQMNILSSSIGVSQSNLTYGNILAVTTNTNFIQPGLGRFSTNSLLFSTASIALSEITIRASHPIPYFQFIRRA